MAREVPRVALEVELAVTDGHKEIPKFRDSTGGWCPSEKEDGTKSAWFWCPRCGLMGSLGGHTIDAEGNVTPSVLCGYNGYLKDGVLQVCGFHETGIRLVGWEP